MATGPGARRVWSKRLLPPAPSPLLKTKISKTHQKNIKSPPKQSPHRSEWAAKIARVRRSSVFNQIWLPGPGGLGHLVAGGQAQPRKYNEKNTSRLSQFGSSIGAVRSPVLQFVVVVVVCPCPMSSSQPLCSEGRTFQCECAFDRIPPSVVLASIQ
mmetsp:Transcript_9129/g.19806  ORF Transcript_9129/g.19806 Transcript_9129/m.19806 type:complete len:156 (+) Transcript_9129:498-965(+)